MKLFIKISCILAIFFKTGNVLSSNNLFNVNNILLERASNTSTQELADNAIKEAFDQLIKRILLKEDISKFNDLNFNNIKELMIYYNISNNLIENDNKINFSITFDREKIHNLLYKKEVLYSDIADKELYILPILINKNELFVFSNNYFYENWNFHEREELIEFILPLENIEIIQKINSNRNNLLDLDLNSLFIEYPKKNIAIVLIENMNSNEKKIFLKSKIQGKLITKSFNIINKNTDKIKFNKKIISSIEDEIIDLVKSQNLIDVRTPSFLNVKFDLNKKSNLFLLKSKINNIKFIEDVFVQKFNKNYVDLKIKYLGKLDKIISQLLIENINLQLSNDEWIIKLL